MSGCSALKSTEPPVCTRAHWGTTWLNNRWDKHVDLRAECFRTRVQFPPPPVLKLTTFIIIFITLNNLLYTLSTDTINFSPKLFIMQRVKIDGTDATNVIVQIKYGSHLYGTATSSSDLDVKGVYIPNARDILLQRIRPVISFKRDKEHGEKNTSQDIDYELYSIAKFLELVADGQSLALEMLFAPESAFLSQPHPLWHEMKTFAHTLFSKQAASFVRYCKKQANKYGIKGARIAVVRIALEHLLNAEEMHGSATKLAVIEDQLRSLTIDNEFLTITESDKPNGTKARYFEICGKKADLDASIKLARLIAQRLIDEYGERALLAEQNDGVDWKAVSHAVRVGREAIEFISTQHLTFPRPDAQHLLDIKNGKIPFQLVSNEIEQIITELDQVVESSNLPEFFDQSSMDNFIEKIYKYQIINSEGL